MLERVRASSSDTTNTSLTQSLTHSTRTLTETVNVIVESVVRESAPWQTECDAALRQIEVPKCLKG